MHSLTGMTFEKQLLSVNVAEPRRVDYTSAPGSLTGIDKQPVAGPVSITVPGPKGTGGSALSGDVIGDKRHHGGHDQAVYAYAREDLDGWGEELGRRLSDGGFGENFTTRGLNVNGALIGERWRIGRDVVLEVNSARIPCRTFAGWLRERGWVKRFTAAAAPGAYLRVIEPGTVKAGDPIEVVHRPDHEVTVSYLFRALTTSSELLPGILAAGDALHPEAARRARERRSA